MAEREPRPGDLLGDRYEIQAELGRGGMATVYRGVDRRLNRRVAVKVFRDGFAESVDPERRTQEMQLLAAVNHPAVVGVLDASTGDGEVGAYLVMELVVGDDLGALLHRARGPLSADFARRIVADVAGALAALHARGVVHRDVKPANILVPQSAHASGVGIAAKLTDFGIAQLVDSAGRTAAETVLGTAAYLSPEQVRGAPPRPASDVYSLGLVLLEALTGKRAFPGPAAEAAMARLHRPPALPPDASPALAELLSRMTALDPDLRPTASQVALALRSQLAGLFLAPDTAATAPTPIAGLVPPPVAARRDAAGETAPQVPVWTPSRGMPITASSAGVTPLPAGPATGAVVTAGAPAIRAPRRFPTVLAVAASALAAAVAGVAISAAAGAFSVPQSADARQPAAAPPPSSSSSTPQPPGDRLVVQQRPQASPSQRRSPKPAASSPTPSDTPSTPSSTPTSPAPSSPAPSSTPSSPAPSSDPAPSAPTSSAPAPSDAPSSAAPASSDVSSDPTATTMLVAAQPDDPTSDPVTTG